MSTPVWHDLRSEAAKPTVVPVTPVTMVPPIRYLSTPGDPLPVPTPAPAPAKPSWLSWVGTILSLVLPFIIANWKYIAALVVITPLYAATFGPRIEADSSSMFSFFFPNEAVRKGQAYRGKLGTTAAAGVDKLITVMESGGKVPDAEAALQAEFKRGRDAAFLADDAPIFAAVVPPNTDPTTEADKKKAAEELAAFIQKWKDFRYGLVKRTLFGL